MSARNQQEFRAPGGLRHPPLEDDPLPPASLPGPQGGMRGHGFRSARGRRLGPDGPAEDLAGDDQRLAVEPLHERRVLTELGGENLDRDGSVKGGLVAFIHQGHAALADLIEDAIRAERLTGSKLVHKGIS